MLKIDSSVFKWAAIVIVSVGLSAILIHPGGDGNLLVRSELVGILIFLTWFLLKVAGKYLNGDKPK